MPIRDSAPYGSLRAQGRRDVSPRSRDMVLSEVCQFIGPLKTKGAGKTGCALHPRSHVQMCIKKCAHEHTGSAKTLRPSLRNGFTTYFALSLAAMLCHHRPREALASQELDASIGASGPHDFAVRAGTTRQPCRPRPPHPAPRFVTIASRPFGGTGWAHYKVDLGLLSKSISENRK